MVPTDTRKAYLVVLATSIGCAIAMLLVGYWPTVRLAGTDGVTAMVCAVSASLGAGLIGSIPVCLALREGGGKVPVAVLLGTMIRFMLVLMLVVALSFSGVVVRVPFVVWVVVSYLVLLTVDTLLFVIIVKRTETTRG